MIAFGPAPSRRLGRSLGINSIPSKICSYSCVYCQLGRTLTLRTDVVELLDPVRILREVSERLTRLRELGQGVDYLTFVPDGEPTLDRSLGEAIRLLKTELGMKVAVITNASLLWRSDVRDALTRADWLSIKVDAGEKRVWRRINRPHPSLKLNRILEGIRLLVEAYAGDLVTETMLVRDVNDSSEALELLANLLSDFRPATAYLAIPTRPPAEKWVRAPEEAVVNRAFQILSRQLPRVELLTGFEGCQFGLTDSVEADLLGLASVHPLREDALSQWLKEANSRWSLVERLLQRGIMVETEYNGRKFYLRNLHRVVAEGVGSTDVGEE